jgi:hypothetical protein
MQSREQIITEMVDLYLYGWTTRAIAETYGIAEQRVSQRLSIAGVLQVKRRPRRQRSAPPASLLAGVKIAAAYFTPDRCIMVADALEALSPDTTDAEDMREQLLQAFRYLAKHGGAVVQARDGIPPHKPQE